MAQRTLPAGPRGSARWMTRPARAGLSAYSVADSSDGCCRWRRAALASGRMCLNRSRIRPLGMSPTPSPPRPSRTRRRCGHLPNRSTFITEIEWENVPASALALLERIRPVDRPGSEGPARQPGPVRGEGLGSQRAWVEDRALCGGGRRGGASRSACAHRRARDPQDAAARLRRQGAGADRARRGRGRGA